MKPFVAAFILVLSLFSAPAFAQSNPVWVQIEARPTLAQGQARAQEYARTLSDVQGYRLPSGWYGIFLGPYERADAQQVLRVYKLERRIPRDSFLAFRSGLRAQFYGDNIAAPTAPTAQTPTVTPEPQAQAAPVILGEETPAEARRAERSLPAEERRLIQTALKWAGVYNSSIDGAFGRGTRRAMGDWQELNGYERTGILTSLQRVALFEQYNSVLDGLGMQLVRNLEAGIEMKIPTDVVSAEKIEPPFVQYNATGDIPARLLLISQAGTRETMAGLFEIMQTLEIVPSDGPRQLRSTSFTLIGENGAMISQTEVSLERGEIKGFTLIWPAGDEDRRRRVIGEMQASFQRLDGVLDPSAGDPDAQQIDLISGLQVRRPTESLSGFYVDRDGAVVTNAALVQNCARITYDETIEAEVFYIDEASGIAVLVPQARLSPPAIARLAKVTPRLQTDVAVAGFSFGGTLNAASVTFGKLADLRGLSGEDGIKRIDIKALKGDVGGPVLDAGGGLLGMLLPEEDGARALPEGVHFVRDRDVLRGVLDKAGIAIGTMDSATPIAPEDLTLAAVDMTVLVSCWSE